MIEASKIGVVGPDDTDGASMEARLFRMMFVIVALGVAGSLLFFQWRVTTGLLLGGCVGLLNHHWLRTSIASAFGKNVVRISAFRFLLRYFVAAVVIATAYMAGVASLTAALVGMCSFAVAGLVEGLMQTFFILAGRDVD